MPSKHTRAQHSRATKRPLSRAKASQLTEKRALWRFTTHCEDMAHNVAHYLFHVLGIKCNLGGSTVFIRADGTPGGSQGISTFYVEARTVKSLVEEAAQFAEDMEAQQSKLVFADGQLWTVQRLVPRERAASVETLTPRAPRLSDYLAPVGMLAGQPVYELPSPEEGERIFKQMREARQ